MKRRNIILLLFLLIAVPAWYWLLVSVPARGVPAHRLDIARLRALATEMPGPRPAAIEVESVASRRVQRALIAAGTGLKRQDVEILAFRLPVPGKDAVMIGSGMNGADAPRRGWHLHPAAQARVDAARRTAALALLTDDPAAAAGAQPHAVAPGIVIIPAPLRSAGSRMIFVQLANGREYLFAGRIAPLALNWQKQRPASRLMGEWLGAENLPEQRGWLRAIAGLRQQAPGIVIVPGRDRRYLADERTHNGMTMGFRQPASASRPH